MEKYRLKEKIMRFAKKEIRILYGKANHALSVCESRIGGRPAVPSGFIWPEYEENGCLGEGAEPIPLSFLAQINLKDIAIYDEEQLLPHSGILSFFYVLDMMNWGIEPSDKGSARVYYFPEEDILEYAEYPDDLHEDAILEELEITFAEHISIPDSESYPADDLDCGWREYEECRKECGYEYDDMSLVTKLLGYPDIVQSPMEEDCEILIRGYSKGSDGTYSALSDAEKAEIKEASKEWLLLFQMGTVSTDETDLMFGDCGHIYFWIRKTDLKALNFNDIWLILQCG